MGKYCAEHSNLKFYSKIIFILIIIPQSNSDRKFHKGKERENSARYATPVGSPCPRPRGEAWRESTVLSCLECTPVWAGASQWAVPGGLLCHTLQNAMVAQRRPLTLPSGKDAIWTAGKGRGALVLVLEVSQPRPGSSSGGNGDAAMHEVPCHQHNHIKGAEHGCPLCLLPGTTLLFLCYSLTLLWESTPFPISVPGVPRRLMQVSQLQSGKP